jgi:mannose PTS system EIIC component
MWHSIVYASLAGGILCLDRIFIQALISRPIVAGPVIGLLLGDLRTGLVTGAFIELLWIDRLAVGAYIPPNETLVAILATAASIIAGRGHGGSTPEIIAAAVLFYIPVGLAGRTVDSRLAIFNNRLSRRAVNAAGRGDIRGIERLHLAGLVIYFAVTTAVLFTALAAGSVALTCLYPLFGEHVQAALLYVYCFLPVLGVAVAVSTVKTRGAVPLFAGVVLACFAAEQWFF